MINIVNKKTHTPSICDSYVGRGSPLGNIYDFRGSQHDQVKFHVSSKEEAINKYEQYLTDCILRGEPAVCDALNYLIIRHKKDQPINLVCFCAPDACHADVIKNKVECAKHCINWFSNMRRMDSPITYQGINFWTTENFYQAMKIPKDNVAERQRFAQLNPMQAKLQIRKIKWTPEWNMDHAIKVMDFALRHKFTKETSWGQKLIDYKKEIIEWNNWQDIDWGRCIYTGQGENRFGKLLMKIRAEIS